MLCSSESSCYGWEQDVSSSGHTVANKELDFLVFDLRLEDIYNDGMELPVA